MTIRTIDLPGLPSDIEVRRSTQRRKTVGAHREDGRTIVTIPDRMSAKDATKHSLELHERLLKRSAAKPRRSDDSLRKRAELLRSRYLPDHTPIPASIEWSSRQRRRWGSCTPANRTIRISDRLKGVPDYVLDSVLVHELAHLLIAEHGPEFKALVAVFPHLERADAFLAGVEFASAM
ncbi:MAG: M48 family metallopeptidase, partial [Actinobacteria bacterium]|nr:M48 family metallopeptidase [Actinomycetota bacterium]